MSHASFLESMKFSRVAVCVAMLALALAGVTPVLADDDDDDDEYRRGPKVKVDDDGKEYKYEYEDGRCKYKYELKYRTGEEKVEKKGDCRGVSPRRAVYHSDVDVIHDEHDSDYQVVPRSSRRIACNRDVIGTVLGGVGGGIAGSHVGHGDGRKVATVAGAIIGAVIGGNIGRRMDRADNGCAYQAFEFASPGETVFWRNPDSRIEYGITPARLTRRTDGRECREYKASGVGGGASQKSSSGVACRRSDGAWQIE
jgi:surface antigen